MKHSMQSHRLARHFSALAALALAGLVACGGGARDYLLVIDTSGSMSAGKEKTIHKVRRSMESFMQTVNPGDTVTLLGFDDKTRTVGTFRIESEEDRAAPVAAVQNLDAWGSHTYMKSMVASVRDQVQELEGRGRNVIVVIMSDGKDDPPPGSRKNRLQLSTIQAPEGEREVDDTFIYYVSLGKLKDPDLEAELKKLSPAVKTIERKAAPEKTAPGSSGDAQSATKTDRAKGGPGAAAADGTSASETADQGSQGSGAAAVDESQAAADEIGLSEVAEDIDRRSWYDKLKSIGKIVAPIVFGVLFLIWLIRKWMNRHKVAGNLQYYEADVGSPIKSNFSLSKTGKSAITVGSKVGADLKVRQSGLPRNIKLKAYRKSGEDFLKTGGGDDDALFKFMTRQQDELISKGDKFRLGNYVFEYGDGEK